MSILKNIVLGSTLLTLSACVEPPHIPDMTGAKTAGIGDTVLEEFSTSDTTDTTTSKVSEVTLTYNGVDKQKALFTRNTHTQLSTLNRPGGTSTFVVQNSTSTSQPGIISSSVSNEISGDGSGTTIINHQAVNFAVDLTSPNKSIIINDSKVVIIAADSTKLIYKVEKN